MGEFLESLRAAVRPENGFDLSFGEAMALIPEYRKDPTAALRDLRGFVEDTYLKDPRITIDPRVIGIAGRVAEAQGFDRHWIGKINLINTIRQGIWDDRRFSCEEEGLIRQETLIAGLIKFHEVDQILQSELGLVRSFDAGVLIERCGQPTHPLRGLTLEWEEEPQEPEVFPKRGPLIAVTAGGEVTLDPDVREPGDEDFVMPFVHPRVLQPLLFSGFSLANAALDHWIPQKGREESRLLRFGSVSAKAVPLLLGGYWAHDLTGHFRNKFNSKVEDYFHRSGTQDGIVDDLAGINATLGLAQGLLLYPSLGVMGDLAYTFHKLDLPFYLAVQEPYIRKFMSKSDGDLSDYREFREERGGSDDQVPLILLSGWLMADLYWPVSRLARYVWNGTEPLDQTRPGAWRLATTGFLAPTGPIFGAKLYHYRRGFGPMPSAVSVETWGSWRRQGGTGYPFGWQVELNRGQLPVRIGSGRLALSLSGIYSANIVDDWRNEEDNKVWRDVVYGGGVGLHAQTRGAEIFVRGDFKTEGFLPNEVYQGGRRVFLGVVFPFY